MHFSKRILVIVGVVTVRTVITDLHERVKLLRLPECVFVVPPEVDVAAHAEDVPAGGSGVKLEVGDVESGGEQVGVRGGQEGGLY